MDAVTLTLVLVIVLALFFDFTNGFHDTANAMATPIATGALKPKVAVLLAAALNLVGAFLSIAVAATSASAHHCFVPMYSLDGPTSSNWIVLTAEDGATFLAGFETKCDGARDAATDPTGPDEGPWRTLRGGSFANLPSACTTTHREPALPERIALTTGFRCVYPP